MQEFLTDYLRQGDGRSEQVAAELASDPAQSSDARVATAVALTAADLAAGRCVQRGRGWAGCPASAAARAAGLPAARPGRWLNPSRAD